MLPLFTNIFKECLITGHITRILCAVELHFYSTSLSDVNVNSEGRQYYDVSLSTCILAASKTHLNTKLAKLLDLIMNENSNRSSNRKPGQALYVTTSAAGTATCLGKPSHTALHSYATLSEEGSDDKLLCKCALCNEYLRQHTDYTLFSTSPK